MNWKNMREENGFTLVELMVVVAIIGILSAVAIPNFKKYQAKSKQSEAKLALSSLYSAESALFTDYDAYAACLDFAGFAPQPKYYAVGFPNAETLGESTVQGNGGSDCTVGAGDGENFFAATRAMGGNGPVTTIGNGSITSNATEYTGYAQGYIVAESGADEDHWSINQNKDVVQEQLGY